MHQQLSLFPFSNPSLLLTPEADPYWDEITNVAPEHSNDDAWNPDDFGEVPFKDDNGQLTIFWDDSLEPPEADDFNSIEEFEQAWQHWQYSVREQVSNTTSSQLDTAVREQSIQALQLAPEHVLAGINKPAENQKCNQWVEVYWVRRANKKHKYYRYCWMEGRKISRVHIGSVTNPLAIARVEKVNDAMSRQCSPMDIKRLIVGSKEGKGNRSRD